MVTGDDVHKNCEKYCNLRTSSYWLQNLGKLSRDFNFGAFEQAEEQITQKKIQFLKFFLLHCFSMFVEYCDDGGGEVMLSNHPTCKLSAFLLLVTLSDPGY